ncbi:tRNA-uridine aminocarboxypropyltransferase 2-like [Pollicipes pollicipes]|uniref:tRNA-uridine aminocarboxypropyltransferase 2-like n=1 Tax=Pollicipes pollicipes TaxID=41117 RepID=UPI0018857441|nr:tRNA-uridine aminocarboxypropyltransferase 2-like [Pollicipes pollicipes]XP_037074848.1 tRNA-uridine aminocarboxypropyltransferase 2-like [Pollicipes pollicipes]XP_037074851.1 tRNA-uridine aminocarboxypropyltransferase 2-like [Pollicipes pollicipes]
MADDLADTLAELPLLVEEDEGRVECERCSRPQLACWCDHLPNPPLDVHTNIIILQHPLEERRALRTAPMIQLGLAPGRCTVYRGKKFPHASHDGLAALLRSPRTVILYPGPEAADVTSLPPAAASEPPYNVLLLDGTWRQAKTMYTMSPALHGVRQVQVSGRLCSSYVVRTQPTNACLSTVEAAAACLQHLEQRPQLGPQLLQPLHALCRVQLSHGAVRHSSKQALIERGEYERQRGARTNRMFRQLGVVL